MPMDNMTSGEYITWTMRVFEGGFDRVLKRWCCDCTTSLEGNENTDQVFLLLAEIIKRTNFTSQLIRSVGRRKTQCPIT